MSGVRIGSSLRAARERRGLSRADVANALCIREPFLEALEKEDAERLPGGAYARAFLRVYGDFLDLDGPRLVEAWDERFGPAEQGEIGPHRPLPTGWQSPVRPLVAIGLSALVLGAGGVLALGLTAQRAATTTTAAARPATVVQVRHAAAPAAHRTHRVATPVLHTVPLRAIGAWDPFGDRAEHDPEAGAATDASPLTFWRTETYVVGLAKPGVGLLLDAGRPVALRRLLVSTDTPGFRALVEAGPNATGPFRPVSTARAAAARTAFALHGRPARFYVVWITRLDHVAHVDDVRALAT